MRQDFDSPEEPGTVDPSPAPAPVAEDAPRSVAAALEVPAFRRIWGANLCTNMGTMIQMVGSGWAMTQLAATPALVALVQTALWTPTMLFAIPAGAAADMYDRRKVAIVACLIALAGSAALATFSGLGLLSPWMLLGFCAVIGTGNALMGPSWQASVVEQVPPRRLPSAVALTSIAMNLARCFGPALGGAIVAAAGAFAAFVINVVGYLPALAVLIAWRRPQPAAPVARDSIARSIADGARYVGRDAPTRAVIIRAFALSLPGGATTGLFPLVSRDLLHGDARTFGLILGAYGLGGVFGAFNLARLRGRVRIEPLLAMCAAGSGAGVLLVAMVHVLPLALTALFVAGGLWVVIFSTLNVEMQISAPGTVVGRVLALFLASSSGGGAIGSALWGLFARDVGVQWALATSGLGMAACALLGLWLRVDPQPAGRR